MNTEKIDELEAARRGAMLAADLPVLASVFAEDLLWVHSSSRLDTKRSLIEKFASGSLRCYRLDHSDVAIRSYGSVSIVQGKLEMDVAVDGVRRMSVNRYAGVWALASGAARLVLWQSTRVQE